MKQLTRYEIGNSSDESSTSGKLRLTMGSSPKFALSLAGSDMTQPFTELKSLELIPGVIMHCVSHCQDKVREYGFAVEQSPLSLSFCTKGRATIAMHSPRRSDADIVHSPATCTLSYLPEAKGKWIPLTRECKFFTLQFHSEVLTDLWGTMEESLGPQLAPLAKGKAPCSFFQGVQTSPTAQTALNSLTLPPPVGEKGRELFMRCKLMETLLLLTSQPHERRTDESSTIFLSKTDVSRIHQAREILEEQMEEPPTLSELARLTGLNEFKLKRGFRQVFSTTPYSHLRDARLNKARKYIESGEMNVCETCTAVGYSNLGNFITLFKKRFGTTPGELRKSALRTLVPS